MEKVKKLKEKGNECFKENQFKDAIELYSDALCIDTISQEDKAVICTNRAICYSKLKEWKKCIEDCNQALSIEPMREKALYRRAEAYEALGEIALAFKDIRMVLNLNAKNQLAIEMARSLKTKLHQDASGIRRALQELVECKDLNRQKNLITAMIAKSAKTTATTDSSFSRELVECGGIPILWDLLSTQPEIVVLFASISGIHSDLAHQVIDGRDLSKVHVILSTTKEHSIGKGAVQFFSNVMTQVLVEKCSVKTHDFQDLSLWSICYNGLLEGLQHENLQIQISALECIIRVVTTKELAVQFTGILQNIFELLDSEDDVLQSRVSLVFSQIFSKYEDDEKVKEQVSLLCVQKLKGNCFSDQVKGAVVLDSLFLVNRDVALWAARQGCTMNRIHTLLQSSNEKIHSIAINVVAHACSSEKDKDLVTSEMFSEVIKLLKSPSIHVRSSAVSIYIKISAISKAFKGESSEGKMLLQAILDILEMEDKSRLQEQQQQQQQDKELDQVVIGLRPRPKERAIEALSYIIVDTDVKEAVVRSPGLDSLTKSSSFHDRASSLSYGLAFILSHIMTSESKLKKKQMAGMDITPDQYEELQKALKQKSEFEDGDLQQKIEFRIKKVVQKGGIRVLCQLCKSQSIKTREMASEAILHASEAKDVRGTLVQQGAIPSLLPIALGNKNISSQGRKNASQAIAKILITTNPSSLQSTTLLSTVKPLITLLKDEEQLLQFEALMALTNLATTGQDAQARILAEKGLSAIQYVQFSDHPLLRRAATEAICNLIPAQEVIDLFKQPPKMRLWLALSDQQDDFETARAAAGALAGASFDDQVAQCMLENDGVPIFQNVLQSTHLELQQRAQVALENLMTLLSKQSKDISHIQHSLNHSLKSQPSTTL